MLFAMTVGDCQQQDCRVLQVVLPVLQGRQSGHQGAWCRPERHCHLRVGPQTNLIYSFLTLCLRLDEINDGEEIQNYLKEKTGQRTVPNIFICEPLNLTQVFLYSYCFVAKQHVGGNDAFQAARRSGKVAELIAQ